jgi:hypothetical protein
MIYTQLVNVFIINLVTKFQNRILSALLITFTTATEMFFSLTFNQNTALRNAAYFSKLRYYAGW